MSSTIKVRLHYWTCRGRAQSLRYMLEDLAATRKNLDYQETFELSTSTWPEHKADPTISGPFGTLPVLHWNEKEIFGQTLTIAQLLAKKFHLYGQPTATIKDPDLLEAYLNGVMCCAYSDVIDNAFISIYKDLDPNDLKSPESQPLQRVHDALRALEELLAKSSTPFYYDQPEPTIADYFAFEAFSAARDIHERYLPKKCPALSKLEEKMRERPGLASYFRRGLLPERFTGAPNESEYLARIKSSI